MRWRCGDCKRSLAKLRSAPMVHDDIWSAVACDPDRQLCDGCLRQRMRRMLGRDLRLEDLTTCRFNMMTAHHQELTLPGEQRINYESAVFAFEHRRQQWLMRKAEALQAVDGMGGSSKGSWGPRV